ncbi:DNAase [Comamonas serinivorans]|uniref:DNAase n=1 Tax=Comamonas serinivorans TaxID=1082851 RepID=A0A1Y0ELG6_9BURK|nr:TatD family hydrolase [Comamonas serinivorans]ARU04416.1 DNAase [Comamonas serinivorans]
MWIDTHCHLDAPELRPDLQAMRARARAAGVPLCVIPAVQAGDFAHAAQLAHTLGDAYALGIHPLYVPRASDADLLALDRALAAHAGDPRLVAVGEIGLDFFVPELVEPAMRAKQLRFYTAQLQLAKAHGLPVILHSRKAVDAVLKGLRQTRVSGGIAHAFNGSAQQAEQLQALGLALGFGGASTFERARHLRTLAAELPATAIVMETDAPDIPPQWLYMTAEARAQGQRPQPNTPAELPRIGAELAALRGVTTDAWAAQTTANALRVLPRLAGWLVQRADGQSS